MAVASEPIKESLFTLLKETFEGSTGSQGTVYLDRGVGLFGTLAAASADDVSREPYPGGATVVAHVHHLLFYVEVLERHMRGDRRRADWSESWALRTVDERGWRELQERLAAAYERLTAFLHEQSEWDERLEGGYDIVVHTAYHLGAVRQLVRIPAPS